MNVFKRVIFCICGVMILFVPKQINAHQFIITDNEISETIVRDQFSLLDASSLFVDPTKLKHIMDRLDEQVYEKPMDATINKQGKIVPEKPGYKLDRSAFKQKFYTLFYNGTKKKMTVPKRKVYPRVDSELLAEIRSKEIGYYVTHYNENNKQRSHNIQLATSSINNHVIFPGEKFSFNKIVGKRTKEKGYKRAPVIVKGELTEDIGGGICQVSSTLFNAVNLDGIQMVERYSHSRQVPYVPPGKDATVSWWGPDFVFKNVYNHPILIRAKASRGKVHVQIFSSEAVEKQDKKE
ncbi:MAG TPA: VanW family protein [Bacillota bacterium]|nr:VanW family protein [Bacillota bacterium]